MAYAKSHDLAVRVEAFQMGGQTKYKYRTIGAVLTNERGDELLLLDRTFNPAGCLQDGKGTIILSKFEKDHEAARVGKARATRSTPAERSDDCPDFDDDIPF